MDRSTSEGGPSSPDGPKPGDLIADRFRIAHFIGSGGMADVFSGINLRTGKRVALKWIRPALATTKEAMARFRREAMAAGRINHPNVVTVFDVIEHESATWLVMELLEGDTLAEVLARVGYMEPEPAIQLLIPAMRGVAAAHAHGVVHRDLKPENIFVCRSADGQPREAKVLDFGVSKLVDESVDHVGITAVGNLVGTPAYMAPEQVRGTAPADARSDVYALGVVLYQMLAGRRPFDEKIYSALLIDIATTEPPPLRSLRPQVPIELEAIVHRAMAREMDRRFPSVNALLAALEDLPRTEDSRAPMRTSGASSGRVLLTGGVGPSSADSGAITTTVTPSANRSRSFARGGALADILTPPAPQRTLAIAAEATSRPRPRAHVLGIASASALLCALVIVAVLLPPKRPSRLEHPGGAASDTTPTASPAPRESTLTVHVSPPSARITVDGIEADGNPVRGRYPSGKTHRIAASAVGYLPKTQEVALPGDVDISLSLEKSEAPPPVPRVRAAGHPADHNDRRAAPRAEPTHPIGASPSRTSASREKAASEPAALVDPKGGTNRVHPIQTTSPYDAQ